jgi:hypothetical protein
MDMNVHLWVPSRLILGDGNYLGPKYISEMYDRDKYIEGLLRVCAYYNPGYTRKNFVDRLVNKIRNLVKVRNAKYHYNGNYYYEYYGFTSEELSMLYNENIDIVQALKSVNFDNLVAYGI